MGHFVPLQQLELNECNGKLNQLWLRPGSDLRIQTANGTCIEAYGNAWQGDSVYLNSCNDDDSQKWLYDGTYLRIMCDTNMCLSVDGNSLIIDVCIETSYIQWTTYTYSE